MLSVQVNILTNSIIESVIGVLLAVFHGRAMTGRGCYEIMLSKFIYVEIDVYGVVEMREQ